MHPLFSSSGVERGTAMGQLDGTEKRNGIGWDGEAEWDSRVVAV